MNQLLKETPKKVYAEPTLEEREHMDEVVWGVNGNVGAGIGTTGISM